MKPEKMKSLFAYPGAKNNLAKQFVQLYPPHRHFISPFGGSAAEIVHKAPSPVETWNDLDGHLHNVFRVIQDDTDYRKLLALLENTPNGRQQYLACRRVLDQPDKHSAVRRAWAFLVCGSVGYRGPHPVQVRSWSDHISGCGRATKSLRDLPCTLMAWRDRFKTVRLEHLDWYALFVKYDAPSTLWFLDPPYHPSTLSGGGLYSHLLTVEQHEQLLRAITTAKGYVMLCGYDHPLYTSYLYHWRKVSFAARTIMGKGRPRREVVWLNYESDNHKIGNDRLLVAKRFVDVAGCMVLARRRYVKRIGALQSLQLANWQNTDRAASHHARQPWRNISDGGTPKRPHQAAHR